MTSYTVTGKEEIEAAKEKNIFIILYLAAKCKNAIKKKKEIRHKRYGGTV